MAKNRSPQSFEKRRREQAKKQKRQEKLERKRAGGTRKDDSDPSPDEEQGSGEDPVGTDAEAQDPDKSGDSAPLA